MNIREKAGDFILDIAKLVFAGVILAGVVTEDIDKAWLYTAGSVVFGVCVALAFTVYRINNNNEGK